MAGKEGEGPSPPPPSRPSTLTRRPPMPLSQPWVGRLPVLTPMIPPPSAARNPLYRGGSSAQAPQGSTMWWQATLTPVDLAVSFAPYVPQSELECLFEGYSLPSHPNVPHTQIGISTTPDVTPRNTIPKRGRESSQMRSEILSDPSGSKEEIEGEQMSDLTDDGEPRQRRRTIQTSSWISPAKPISGTDLLHGPDVPDDGYCWNKYMHRTFQESQSFYYMCSHPGCSAKKQVTIFFFGYHNNPSTAYKGKHNHVKQHSQ